MIYRIVKRCSNVRLSGLALIVLSPIFMIAYGEHTKYFKCIWEV